MVPESKSSVVTFPYERQASMGEEMPDALTYPDQILYLSFRMLYAQLRAGLIDREAAICEKRKLIKEYQHYQFMEQLCRERVDLVKQTEIARSEYRKNRTLENADKLVALIEGRKDVAAARKAELVGDDAKSLLAPGDVVYTTNGREIIQAKIINILADHLLTDVDCLFYDEHGTTWWLTQRVAKEKINNG